MGLNTLLICVSNDFTWIVEHSLSGLSLSLWNCQVQLSFWDSLLTSIFAALAEPSMGQNWSIFPNLVVTLPSTRLERMDWFWPGMDHRCATVCTTTNKKSATFLFWTVTKTNYVSKCSDFQKKLIDTITTRNLYLKSKENNENGMAAQVIWAALLQPTAEPNRPKSWFWCCCHSTPCIFHWF